MATHNKKRIGIIVLILVVLAGAGGGGYYWWLTQQTAGAVLKYAGSLEAREYQVASAIAGRVASVAVAEGDTVKAGQTLVQLDTTALQLQLDQAQQGVNAAEAAVDSARRTGTSADVAAAQARLEQAKAGVELAKVQLGYATITAPHDGVIIVVTTNAGQNASPGKTLLTIKDPTDMYVRVFVAETRIGQVKVGQSASIKTDSSTQTFTGTVSFIASQAEFTPNNVETQEQRTKLVFEVRVRVSDTSGTLKVGMPVDVTFA